MAIFNSQLLNDQRVFRVPGFKDQDQDSGEFTVGFDLGPGLVPSFNHDWTPSKLKNDMILSYKYVLHTTLHDEDVTLEYTRY